MSYPVKAKAISQALADVPQADEISLEFTYWRSTVAGHKAGQTTVIVSVQYRYDKASQYTPRYFEEEGYNDPKWTITIQPIPSAVKHHVAQLLESQAFPLIGDWLFAKRDVTGREESHGFHVFYNEAEDRLEYS